ncbi:MAG: hypothetical protein DI598_13705 [Pseudopedobacter saltans]|uniref:Uncharacterized protein n=1 Tax=Pseudopedobacter saltans TaxID=151895 RepID=A0A2W5GT24_9SPHI|nr:MAG: hypothetical protein DI598_13705 [Pseudopedobacter saltans]
MEKEIFEFIVLCLDNDKRYRIILSATIETSRRELMVQAKKDIGTSNFIEESFKMIQRDDYLSYFINLANNPMVIEIK